MTVRACLTRAVILQIETKTVKTRKLIYGLERKRLACIVGAASTNTHSNDQFPSQRIPRQRFERRFTRSASERLALQSLAPYISNLRLGFDWHTRKIFFSGSDHLIGNNGSDFIGNFFVALDDKFVVNAMDNLRIEIL